MYEISTDGEIGGFKIFCRESELPQHWKNFLQQWAYGSKQVYIHLKTPGMLSV